MKRELVERARQFRKEPTRGEALLWEALRGGKLGVRFHRQEVIGPFIVDFVCRHARLILEVDGPVHEEQRERDLERQQWLESQGYCVLRFSADEVEGALQPVVDRILSALRPNLPAPND